MKKQVLTLALAMIASNIAMNNALAASTSSQQGVDFSVSSVEKIIEKAASASGVVVSISTKAGDSLENIVDAINAEKTQQMRKGGAHYALGSVSAVGAFTVSAVQKIVEGATYVTKYTFTGLQSGSELSLTMTEKYVATPVAKGVDSTSQAIADGAMYLGEKTVDGATYVGGKAKKIGRKTWNIGTGVVLGLSASGAVLAQEVTKAADAGADSHSLTSAAILLGSVSVSAQALGSEVVKGYKK